MRSSTSNKNGVNMLPNNVALLTGVKNDNQRDVIEFILKAHSDLMPTLLKVTSVWPVKVWFNKPVQVVNAQRHHQTVTQFTFRRFFLSTSKVFCHMHRANGRNGFPVYFKLEDIEKYEIVIPTEHAFADFEQFKAKFDPRFMTETEILRTWNLNSPQHGGKYDKRDFHRIGSKGKIALRQFLNNFSSVNETSNEKYSVGIGEGSVYVRGNFNSMSCNEHFGRDIKIEHKLGLPYVWYTSEFPGCGNGSYGLLANEKEWLHVEND